MSTTDSTDMLDKLQNFTMTLLAGKEYYIEQIIAEVAEIKEKYPQFYERILNDIASTHDGHSNIADPCRRCFFISTLNGNPPEHCTDCNKTIWCVRCMPNGTYFEEDRGLVCGTCYCTAPSVISPPPRDVRWLRIEQQPKADPVYYNFDREYK
jgi:hypothetical protein